MGQGSQAPSVPLECSLISDRADVSVSLCFTDRARIEHKMLGQRSHPFKMGSEA